MPYRLATPQRSPFSVIHFPRSVKPFYAKAKILIVFFGKSAIVSDVANAPVAQLDRVSASEAEGRGFESRRARQLEKNPLFGDFFVGAKRRGEEATRALARDGLGIYRHPCQQITGLLHPLRGSQFRIIILHFVKNKYKIEITRSEATW